MSNRLQGRTALITGSTGNIGRAVATAFAREGGQVLVTGRCAERGLEVVEEIRRDGGQAEFVAIDLDGSATASRRLATEALQLLDGRVDILINNAGVTPGDTTPLTEEAVFDRAFAVNVKAPFYLTAALVPMMSANGGGVVINITSWVAQLGIPFAAVYTSTKGALETLTRAWSAEFGTQGVRVNAISPGVMHPSGQMESPAEFMMKGTPAGASGTGDAIAEAALYLASDGAAFVHGSVLSVDGGRTGAAVFAA